MDSQTAKFSFEILTDRTLLEQIWLAYFLTVDFISGKSIGNFESPFGAKFSMKFDWHSSLTWNQKQWIINYGASRILPLCREEQVSFWQLWAQYVQTHIPKLLAIVNYI